MHPHEAEAVRTIRGASPVFVKMNSCLTGPPFSAIVPKSCEVWANSIAGSLAACGLAALRVRDAADKSAAEIMNGSFFIFVFIFGMLSGYIVRFLPASIPQAAIMSSLAMLVWWL